ncbi:MAG: type II secretion system F family protein [Gammaproteobacteria bacterium]|nr:type II secretion system F family protein [Gammaproteobacteria bacterium]
MAKTQEKVAFLWEGKDKKGKRVKGEDYGMSEAIIKASLRKRGINPLKVKKKPKALFGGKQKITPADIAIFSRQLATMMKAGVPMVQSFDIIGQGNDNKSMEELIMAIKSDVEAGNNLAYSLAKHPYYFDDLFVNLVNAGEQSGALETMLDKLATYKEKTEAIKKKIKKALFYPVAVMVVAFIVTAILLIFVVPQFETLFQGFGADLPAFTVMIINLSKWMQANWWIVVIVVGGSLKAFTEAKRRSRKFAQWFDKVLLSVPVIGGILHKSAIARFCRTLATMFTAGVPLVEAMESVAGATGNIVYSTATLKIKDEVATGTQLQQAMKNVDLFPNMVIQMVAIGEESGALDHMLDKVADFYEEEVDNAVDAMSSLMEPLIMAVLGVLVGGLIIAMYLPIFKLGSVV